MATYTMRLEEVLDAVFGGMEQFEVQYDEMVFDGVTYGRMPVIPDADKLGLGGYPIFDENYRKILNAKIVDEYFLREIGQETIDVWRLFMRRKMNRIMPYYNKLYESERIDYSALVTMDIRTNGEANMSAEEASTSQAAVDALTTSEGRAVTSQTPQTMLSGHGDYATGASDSSSDSFNESETISQSESNTNTSTESQNRVTGFQGVSSDLVTRYRQSLLNIDSMILTEIEDMFMLVLNNGDSYTRNNQGWFFA